ncbi:unnamed protein product [Discula destructiva]
MLLINALLVATTVAVSTAPQKPTARGLHVPSLYVPACPAVGMISYDNTVPSSDNSTFPETDVSLCYDDSFIHITLTALEEKSFYYNASVPTNGDIYDYEVMESFIYRGTNDPATYLEFEVAPNNVTFSAFIYNPSKIRATDAAFDRFYITDLAADKLSATTTLDVAGEKWTSNVQIPLGFFNVESGCARGTKWRMNFFRTVTSKATFPTQAYGAWSAPNETNFHMTPFFGHVTFI